MMMMKAAMVVMVLMMMVVMMMAIMVVMSDGCDPAAGLIAMARCFFQSAVSWNLDLTDEFPWYVHDILQFRIAFIFVKLCSINSSQQVLHKKCKSDTSKWPWYLACAVFTLRDVFSFSYTYACYKDLRSLHERWISTSDFQVNISLMILCDTYVSGNDFNFAFFEGFKNVLYFTCSNGFASCTNPFTKATVPAHETLSHAETRNWDCSAVAAGGSVSYCEDCKDATSNAVEQVIIALIFVLPTILGDIQRGADKLRPDLA